MKMKANRKALSLSALEACKSDVSSGEIAIYWLISMFSQRFPHTSMHLAFYIVVERVVWTGSLLIVLFSSYLPIKKCFTIKPIRIDV